MTYRLANARDLDAVCALVRAAVAEMVRGGIDQWDDIYPSRNDLRSDIERAQLTVGETAGEICVIFTINKECDAQYQGGDWQYRGESWRVLHRLCVDPRHWHQGIAAAALAHIEAVLRAQGVKAIRLDVFDGNAGAVSLYQKNGYRKAGAARWRKGTFSLMEKRL
ncbi:MAG: GNAT family N-acetyltransferase [Oscillospiraceae bacterium]|nr:GNAT family N-acetyltransferase [Oscillospiraceae bacterium]